MLAHLRVRNLGVIEDGELEPSAGFTVITGETGAGKTLLLGALRLLTGEKGRTDAVGPFGDEAQADGLFLEGGSELGVSRLLPREGRSRAYLEGALVSAPVLGERVGSLVEIVGQHDQLRIRRSGALLELVDRALDEAGSDARARYREAWAALSGALSAQESLGGDRPALERELDLTRHQAREIDAASLDPDDDEIAAALASKLRNSEVIREQLSAAVTAATAMSEMAGEVVASVRKVAELDPGLSEGRELAEGVSAEMSEVVRLLREKLEEARDDPASLAAAEERLTLLGDLKRKYGRTISDVIEFGADASERARSLEGLLDRASTIEDEVARASELVEGSATELTRARRVAVQSIQAEAAGHLTGLGMPTASIELALEEVSAGPTGADRIAVLFSSHERLTAGRIEDVASGGELSRLVLALRLATSADQATTLVFDEVDAGVGGATALALGRKLSELARGTQLLCVTHLPQVAAHADTHYVVRRVDAGAEVARVEGEQRVEELSRMLAGLPDSAGGRGAAVELLETARS
jgi:DNA repair protein RecN (Recombination protein N)